MKCFIMITLLYDLYFHGGNTPDVIHLLSQWCKESNPGLPHNACIPDLLSSQILCIFCGRRRGKFWVIFKGTPFLC